MTLSKVGHFMYGLAGMFVICQIILPLMYVFVVLAKAFLIWEPVAFIPVSMLALRTLELVFAGISVWFATSKDWWELYEND
jgi:hypothetical protein